MLRLDLSQDRRRGGYAINRGGEYATLKVDDREHVRVDRARIRDSDSGEIKRSPVQRNFCALGASALSVWNPRWPQLVHPFASAIDTDLPIPPERTHLMLSSKASWVQLCGKPRDQHFPGYPAESIAGWHERLGLVGTS